MTPAIKKLTRRERNGEVKRRLFDAAATIVGKLGYAEASVARITELAGIAQGTFYNHFDSRQSLLDELLPTLGLEMAHFIQERAKIAPTEEAREIARFAAFFQYIRENPGFRRILNEAEFAAPTAFQKHIDNMSAAYQRILKEAHGRGELEPFKDEELEIVVHILMGARSYLSQRFGGAGAADDIVIGAYAKLIRNGLLRQDIDAKPVLSDRD